MKKLMSNCLKKWQPYFAAALLGILTMFAFAPFGVYLFAVIATTLLAAMLYRANTSYSFWVGFYYGLGLFGSGVYWVYISISRFGDVNIMIAALITAGLVAIMSLYPACACYALNRYFSKETPLKLTCAFPAIWLLTEWLRGMFFSGFPWLMLGYSQTNSPLRGYAPIVSVYGITVLIMLTSGLLVNSYVTWRKKDYSTTYLNLLGVGIIWVCGSLLSLILWTKPADKPVTVSLVQGNIAQSLKWDPERVNLSLDTYRELSEPLWGKSDIIIWPEVAIPLPLDTAEEYVTSMSKKAADNNATLIYGIPEPAANSGRYYNTLLATGKSNAVYRKRLLVPFGEYVPMEQYVARIFDFMNVPMSNMVAGESHQAPLVVGDIKIIPSICYEIAYPDFSRTADASPSMLLTVTNDAWFGESTAQAQHLQMAIMRSIEMARPGLFVSNDGITAIINPKGIIESAAPVRTRFVLQGKIQAYEGLTPWMRNGSDIALAPAILMLIAARRAQTLSKRKAALATASKTHK